MLTGTPQDGADPERVGRRHGGEMDVDVGLAAASEAAGGGGEGAQRHPLVGVEAAALAQVGGGPERVPGREPGEGGDAVERALVLEPVRLDPPRAALQRARGTGHGLDPDPPAGGGERGDVPGHELLGEDREVVGGDHDPATACLCLRPRDRARGGVAAPVADRLRGDDHSVDRLQARAVELPGDGEAGGPGDRPRERADEPRRRHRARAAAVQPGVPRRVHRELADDLAQRLAVVVLDDRAGPVGELPAGVAEAPAELELGTERRALQKAAELGEGAAADEQVRGRGRRPARQLHAARLAQHLPAGRPPGHHRVLAGGRLDQAGDGAGPLADRLGQVVVDQRGRGQGVGVEKEEPLARGMLGGDVARVVGGALVGRGHDPQALERDAARRRGDDAAARRVVGDDQLVGGTEPQRPRERGARPRPPPRNRERA